MCDQESEIVSYFYLLRNYNYIWFCQANKCCEIKLYPAQLKTYRDRFFAGHICNSDNIVSHLADFSTSFQSILCINNQKGRSHLDMILSTEAPLWLKLMLLYIIFLFFFNFIMIVHEIGRVKEHPLVLTCITKLLLISDRGIKMRKIGEWVVLQLFLFLRICLHT